MFAQLMQGMKPGTILPGDLSEGSGVEGRRTSRKEAPASPVTDQESGAETRATPHRTKKDFRGSGHLHFHEGGDADIFDSTRS
jgi:hypothetical protein